jgi:hypothetical protein
LILAHANVRVLEIEKNLGWKGGDFLNGHSWPSCRPSSPQQELVSRGGRDHGVVAATSIPQVVRGSNHRRSHLVVPGTYSFLHGRRQLNEEHHKEQIIIRADAMWKVLFEFIHKNARFNVLHV